MKHLLLSSLLIGSACGGSKPQPAPVAPAPVEPVAKEAPPPPPKHATATMAGTSKWKSVKGTVQFKEVDDGVEVTANLEGLKKGKHGFHIHEKGDCSAPDAKSAGGHFNPSGHDHGSPDAEQHHAGDLGNINAGPDGKATLTLVVKGVTLKDGDTSIVGKGFIIHDKADDLKTQPTGNAGDRIACGVIALDEAAAKE